MPYREPEVRKAKAREYSNTWRAKHPERSRANQRRSYHKHPATKRAIHLKRRYSMTTADYDALYTQQDGRCLICLKVAPRAGLGGLRVDHNHTTGVVRGLLCGTCNSGIGHLKDDPVLLNRAIDYLTSHLELPKET